MPDETPVSPAFAKPPRRAAEFRALYEQSEAGQYARQMNQPQSQPPVQEATQSPADALNQPYQPQAPAQPLPLFEQQFAQREAPAAQQPAQQEPAYDPQLTQRLLAEREEMRKLIQDQQDALNKIAAERQAAADAARKENLVDTALQSPELQDLATVDPEDARRLISAAANAVAAPIRQMQEDLAQQRAAATEAQQAAINRRRSEEVLSAHPDFFKLYENPQFLEYLNGHDDFHSKTRGQIALEEFEAGNTAYVNNFINRFKQGTPDARHIASVPPVQVAGSSPYYADSGRGQPKVDYSLKELNDLFQMRRISHDQYRQMLKEWRAANPQ